MITFTFFSLPSTTCECSFIVCTKQFRKLIVELRFCSKTWFFVLVNYNFRFRQIHTPKLVGGTVTNLLFVPDYKLVIQATYDKSVMHVLFVVFFRKRCSQILHNEQETSQEIVSYDLLPHSRNCCFLKLSFMLYQIQ